MSDARHPAFDRDGQYLYFTASTNYGPTSSGLDMTSDEHEVTSSVYLIVLPNNVASPLAPESDEEKARRRPQRRRRPRRAGRKQRGGQAPPKPVRIDFDKIAAAHCRAAASGAHLSDRSTAGKRGNHLHCWRGRGGRRNAARAAATTLSKFDLKTRKTEKLADGVRVVRSLRQRRKDAAAHGRRRRRARGAGRPRRALRGPQYVIVPAGAPVKAGEGALRLADVEVNVDPIAEWKQMYHEVWRIERSYFYDPNLHGVNAADVERRNTRSIWTRWARAPI